MRWFRWILSGLVLASVIAVASPGTGLAAGTPRAQFWSDPVYAGYKLDKDVWSQGYALISDLSEEGLSCWFCNGNWDNRISSLSTTGGGQSPVDLLVYTEKYYAGMCVYIPKNTTIHNLQIVPLQRPWGWTDLDKKISSFKVYEYSILPPANCAVYEPWFVVP